MACNESGIWSDKSAGKTFYNQVKSNLVINMQALVVDKLTLTETAQNSWKY